jgi:hypothetical protein
MAGGHPILPAGRHGDLSTGTHGIPEPFSPARTAPPPHGRAEARRPSIMPRVYPRSRQFVSVAQPRLACAPLRRDRVRDPIGKKPEHLGCPADAQLAGYRSTHETRPRRQLLASSVSEGCKGRAAIAHNLREDHSTAASATETIDTTRPITHAFECCEDMTAAMTTPIATMPAVATNRMSGASSGGRLPRRGTITPGSCARFSRCSRRAVRRSSRSRSCRFWPPAGLVDMT